MTEDLRFNPDWCISPGETLRDWMEENRLSPRVTAGLCHMEQRRFERLLDGRVRITAAVAEKLDFGTGIPASLWLNLERAFRQGLAEGKTWIH